MIRTQVYDPASGTVQDGRKELIAIWKQSESLLIWLDLQGNPRQEEKTLLSEQFGLHPLAIEDAQKVRHPPKIEQFGSTLFILLKGLDAESESIDFGTIQLAMFTGKRFFITRHSKDSVSTDKMWAKTLKDGHVFTREPLAMALDLSELIVSRYLKILLKLEPRLEEIEDEVMLSPKDTLLYELSVYRSNLKKMRRYLTYQVQLFDDLRDGQEYQLEHDLTHEINHIYIQLERANSLATLFYELASDLMDSYISMASHHLNNIMKILTIVTVIFIPLTFLAGIYGMNFENIPELKAEYGYFTVLGVMSFISVMLLYIFRKVRWL